MSERTIPDEWVETAARAEWDHYKPDLDGGPWEGLTEAQRASWREGVEVVLAAAIPLVTPAIKAAALREAADRELAAWESVPMSPDWMEAIESVCETLRARADQIEKEDA